jgi:hypothetical protein
VIQNSRTQCAKFNFDLLYQATFKEAKKICEKDGMDMLSFESSEEVKKIQDYLSYIGNLE